MKRSVECPDGGIVTIRDKNNGSQRLQESESNVGNLEFQQSRNAVNRYGVEDEHDSSNNFLYIGCDLGIRQPFERKFEDVVVKPVNGPIAITIRIIPVGCNSCDCLQATVWIVIFIIYEC